ncbi:MAG: hypothetical protein C4B59_06225 [Candidatus Methanogaster sp.]|uniref:Uncharacterized protein n=1 Tax=Candidatus Methanogaster sp. TaxID=3386292 RepID=A0AC61L3R0_9EURY|nr:MAG: hypothetical protein C4B59_06225 [ANME-2 cluster archaeon]
MGGVDFDRLFFGRHSAGYSAPGNYTVTLRVKDKHGNADTDTTVVNTPPAAAVPSMTPVGTMILIGSLSLLAVSRIRRRFD